MADRITPTREMFEEANPERKMLYLYDMIDSMGSKCPLQLALCRQEFVPKRWLWIALSVLLCSAALIGVAEPKTVVRILQFILGGI